MCSSAFSRCASCPREDRRRADALHSRGFPSRGRLAFAGFPLRRHFPPGLTSARSIEAEISHEAGWNVKNGPVAMRKPSFGFS